MCDHKNREAAMIVLDPGTPAKHGRDGVWCDPCLAPLVAALNAAGLRTVASCCGHGRRPSRISLADGRELLVTDSGTMSSLSGLWPGINDEPARSQVALMPEQSDV